MLILAMLIAVSRRKIATFPVAKMILVCSFFYYLLQVASLMSPLMEDTQAVVASTCFTGTR